MELPPPSTVQEPQAAEASKAASVEGAPQTDLMPEAAEASKAASAEGAPQPDLMSEASLELGAAGLELPPPSMVQEPQAAEEESKALFTGRVASCPTSEPTTTNEVRSARITAQRRRPDLDPSRATRRSYSIQASQMAANVATQMRRRSSAALTPKGRAKLKRLTEARGRRRHYLSTARWAQDDALQHDDHRMLRNIGLGPLPGAGATAKAGRKRWGGHKADFTRKVNKTLKSRAKSAIENSMFVKPKRLRKTTPRMKAARAIMSDWRMEVFMLLLTVYALFAVDLVVIYGSAATDWLFGWVSFVVML